MNDINDTLRLTLYDPLQLDEQSFIQGFVARKKDLQQLVQRIKQSKKRPDESAHTVIYAHRGMGKTSLLRRIAIEINQDPTLASDWLPLNYREEQYNINSLHQLWCNTVDSLADWCEKQNDVKTAKELDRLLDDINKNDDLYPKIKNIAQQKNKRLVLLLDNINLILSTLSQNEQWQLRNILQAEDGPLVIACTSDLP